MSFYKNLDKDLFDLRLHRGLDKWLSQKHPPTFTRARLLELATQDTNINEEPWLLKVLASSWVAGVRVLSTQNYPKGRYQSIQVVDMVLMRNTF